MNKPLKLAALYASFLSLAVLTAAQADAQRRGGGGGRASMSRPSGGGSFNRSSQVRSSAQGSVNRAGRSQQMAGANRATRPSTGNVGAGNVGSGNRTNVGSGNVNSGNRTNINTGNINTGDINVDVDRDWGCCDYHGGWGGFYAGAAVGATVAAATTAAVVGSYYSTLPAGCVTTVSGTVTYYHCGSVWYKPIYSGMSVQYVVVTTP